MATVRNHSKGKSKSKSKSKSRSKPKSKSKPRAKAKPRQKRKTTASKAVAGKKAAAKRSVKKASAKKRPVRKSAKRKVVTQKAVSRKKASGADRKRYIVPLEVDTSLAEEELRLLRDPLAFHSTKRGDGRQDVLLDRRDPYARSTYRGPERRKNRWDRRKTDR